MYRPQVRTIQDKICPNAAVVQDGGASHSDAEIKDTKHGGLFLRPDMKLNRRQGTNLKIIYYLCPTIEFFNKNKTKMMKLVDTAGRVDKFMSRYAKRYDKKNAAK